MKLNGKEVLRQICFHGKILLRGMAKTLFGTAVAGIMALAVYGFMTIPSEGGYTAVCEFIAACATLTIGLTSMYFFGCKRRRRR